MHKKEETIGRRLRALREARDMTQEEIGNYLELKRASISAIELGKSDLTMDNLIKLTQLFNISTDELVFGFKDNGPYHGGKERIMPVVVDPQNNPIIKILPQTAQAGYLQARADPQYWDELPEISLPDRKYRTGHFIGIQVWGESMLNTLVGGDWIICQFVENQSYINFGEIYVVVTENRSPVIKRIERDEDPECFQLVSDNQSHKPYSVLKSEVIEVWRYDTLIRWQPFTLKKLTDETRS